MATYKTPSEGGSGGKRGHSNMAHWTHTEEIKDAANIHRRRDDKLEVEAEMAEEMSDGIPEKSLGFQIKCVEDGWLDSVLSSELGQYLVTASYLSDAPRDFLMSCSALAEGATESTCSWMEEPGRFTFDFGRISDRLDIKIRFIDDSGGESLFVHARPLLIAWCRDVAAEFRRIWQELGPDGYRAGWVHYPFPLRELERLERAIAS